MPQPSRTTLPDVVGPIQAYPYSAALKECLDLNNKNTYWIYSEAEKKILRLVILPQQEAEVGTFYCGCRIIIENKITYLCMSINAGMYEPPEIAYDRAMAVIGRR